jgi:mannose-6-phosphate isomerase-like protein (cupin superfamily)
MDTNISIKQEENKTPWPFPEELDALTADPLHHKLLFENEHVRILDTCILPGETTHVHTHRFPAALYVISWSDFIRYDAQGNVVLDSRTLPKTPAPFSGLWISALAPHSLQNVGNSELHIISTEIKSPV